MKKIKSWLLGWLSKDIDLIYTSKGNIPVNMLERKLEWKFFTGHIQLREMYFLDGEMVKDGVDVYKLPEGTELYIKQGELG